MAEQLSPFMTAEELCNRYKIAKSTLYGWMAKGYFPRPKKFGWTVARWHRQKVEAFELENGLVEEGEQTPPDFLPDKPTDRSTERC